MQRLTLEPRHLRLRGELLIPAVYFAPKTEASTSLMGTEMMSGTNRLKRMVAQVKAYRSRLHQLISVIQDEYLESFMAAVTRLCRHGTGRPPRAL